MLVSAVVVMLTVASAPPAAIAASGIVSADTFLGWEIGEARRYAIGPDGALRAGESITWGVRLDRVESVAGRSIGVFELTHQHNRWGIGLTGSMIVKWDYSGEARINEHGFPEEIRFSMFEAHEGERPWRGEVMSAAYTFQGDEYLKTIRVPDQQWDFRVPIARYRDVDLDVPSGTFLFRPRAADTDFFTNPALLGLVIPDVLPDAWKQRVQFFRPTYPTRYPGAAYATVDRNTRLSVRRYYVQRTLELRETAELEIGGRTLNVRKMSVSGALRDVYLDEFGRVVRIDLDPDPITLENRFVRLLFPSEY